MLFGVRPEPLAVFAIVHNKTGSTLVKGSAIHAPATGLDLCEPLLLTAVGAVDMDISHGKQGLIRVHSATFHLD